MSDKHMQVDLLTYDYILLSGCLQIQTLGTKLHRDIIGSKVSNFFSIYVLYFGSCSQLPAILTEKNIGKRDHAILDNVLYVL